MQAPQFHGSPQNKSQGIKTVPHAYGVLHTAIFSKRLFKAFTKMPTNIPARFNNGTRRIFQDIHVRSIKTFKVEKRNFSHNTP